MQRAVTLLAAIFCLVQPLAGRADEGVGTIKEIVKDLCQAPNESGRYLKASGGGELGADVRVRLLGLVGAEGNAEFSQEEWEGVRAVLREDQAGENKNYRECVVTLTPLFLRKFASEPDVSSDRLRSVQQEMHNSPGGIQAGRDVNLLDDSLPQLSVHSAEVRELDDDLREWRISFSRSKRGDLGVIELDVEVLSNTGELLSIKIEGAYQVLGGGGASMRTADHYSRLIDAKRGRAGLSLETRRLTGTPTLTVRTSGDPILQISGSHDIGPTRISPDGEVQPSPSS